MQTDVEMHISMPVVPPLLIVCIDRKKLHLLRMARNPTKAVASYNVLRNIITGTISSESQDIGRTEGLKIQKFDFRTSVYGKFIY